MWVVFECMVTFSDFNTATPTRAKAQFGGKTWPIVRFEGIVTVVDRVCSVCQLPHLTRSQQGDDKINATFKYSVPFPGRELYVISGGFSL